MTRFPVRFKTGLVCSGQLSEHGECPEISRGFFFCFLFLVCLCLPASSGTRISEELESVLKRNRECAVVEATVRDFQFTQWESQDRIEIQIEDPLIRRAGTLEKHPTRSLVFSAYRPPIHRNRKNRSVYTTGSGLEFQVKRGQRYLFLCGSEQSCFRVESVERLNRILDCLSML